MSNPPASKGNIGSVSLLGAVSIGVGGMVGGGIFAVLGESIQLAKGSTPWAFLAAGLIAAATAWSYARLSVKWPDAGGTVVFIHAAFGHRPTSGGLNLSLWLSYLVTLAMYALAFASYAATFLPPGGNYRTGLVVLAVLLPTGLNLWNPDAVSKVESLIVSIKVAILLLVMFAGFSAINGQAFAPSNQVSFSEIIAAGMSIFVAYEGFELIANSAPDMKDRTKNLPRAYFITVLFVIALYIGIAIVAVGAVPASEVAKVSDFVLAEAAKPSLGQAGFTLVGIAAVLATLSAINATIYGNGRLAWTLATQRELPADLGDGTSRHPTAGILSTAIISLVLALTLDLSQVASVASAGFLLVFMTVNAAAWVTAGQMGSARFVPGIGVIATAWALFILLSKMWGAQRVSFWLFLGMLICAWAAEALLERRAPGKLQHKLDGHLAAHQT